MYGQHRHNIALMNYRLLSQVFKSTWFADPRWIDANFFIVEQMLKGSAFSLIDEAEEKERKSLKVFNKLSRSAETVNSYQDAPEGSVAIIRVRGAMMKYDNCGEVGTETIRGWINQAMITPNIVGAVVWIDTPGGTVDGTESLADDIANAPKPVVAFVDGMACSAGVWIASGARHIFIENKTAEMGSVGVMFSFMDQTARMEQMGIKYHYITADQSPDKNLDFLEAKKGNYELIKAAGLNPLADMFINTLKKNRGAKIPADAPIFTGKVFFGDETISYGLADSFGTLTNAVEKVMELAGQQAINIIEKAAKKPNKSYLQMSKFKRLAALMGVAQIELTDEGAFISEAHLTAVEARLEQAATAETERDQARTELQTAQSSLTERDNTIAERDRAIVALQGARGTDTKQVDPPAGSGSDNVSLIDACKGSTNSALAALEAAGFTY